MVLAISSMTMRRLRSGVAREFETGTRVGYFELYDLEQELSRMLGGRKVDLRTPEDLSRYFREEVVAQAQVQYAHE